MVNYYQIFSKSSHVVLGVIINRFATIKLFVLLSITVLLYSLHNLLYLGNNLILALSIPLGVVIYVIALFCPRNNIWQFSGMFRNHYFYFSGRVMLSHLVKRSGLSEKKIIMDCNAYGSL